VAIKLPTKLYIVQGNQLASLKITEKGIGARNQEEDQTVSEYHTSNAASA
jgi:hypothetical protein